LLFESFTLRYDCHYYFAAYDFLLLHCRRYLSYALMMLMMPLITFRHYYDCAMMLLMMPPLFMMLPFAFRDVAITLPRCRAMLDAHATPC